MMLVALIAAVLPLCTPTDEEPVWPVAPPPEPPWSREDAGVLGGKCTFFDFPRGFEDEFEAVRAACRTRDPRKEARALDRLVEALQELKPTRGSTASDVLRDAAWRRALVHAQLANDRAGRMPKAPRARCTTPVR